MLKARIQKHQLEFQTKKGSRPHTNIQFGLELLSILESRLESRLKHSTAELQSIQQFWLQVDIV